MERNCSTCAFDKVNKCKILTERIPKNCFAWADKQEAKRREEACREYTMAFGGLYTIPKTHLPEERKEKRNKNRKLNLNKRDGKSVREVLEEHFNWWYMQGKTDSEIAEKLYISSKAVSSYRKDKFLKPNIKDRTTGMETVGSN